MIFVLDNYDSFVYNLVQYLGELGEKIVVFRNDKISVNKVKKMDPSAIFISPGPCTPNEAGISVEMVRSLGSLFPIFGVCLGHQAIAAAFGGKIVRADEVVHGKTSSIYHDGKTIFQDIENGFAATRYHSLIVERGTLSDCFEISAWTEDGIIMGLRHKVFRVEGVQFHPESILTDVGKQILKNFLDKREVPS
ncbi:aminodeoxychorismate/anthranilate synthase component II [bacterium]|nr:aminodeoxychorismate/anthranilate synthase component II [bacterium]